MAKIMIELPHVGESITEGVIGKWLKSPGDSVDKYEPLLEVVTDKVNMEVPSPFSGIVVRLLVGEGDVVPMGALIAEMDVEGETPTKTHRSDMSDAPESITENSGERQFEFMDNVRSVGPTGSGEGGAGRPDASLKEHSELKNDSSDIDEFDRTASHARLSPVVKQLIREHRLDISSLIGTGSQGRITKMDVLQHIASSTEQSRNPMSSNLDQEVVTLNPVRKTMAERMERSSREIPAAWTMVEVDVQGLANCREISKREFRRNSGVPLTYLPFVVQATSQALKEYSLLNGTWAGDHILLNKNIHIGIAVSSPHGLIVPVIHNADTMNITELAVRIYTLVKAAGLGKLQLDEVQGGTFTVDNTAALGLVASVPIINGSQAAILASEAIVKRPVVYEGSIQARYVMNLSLTFDHRVCDGADAGKFLARIKGILESITGETTVN